VTDSTATRAERETLGFQAEVRQLLQLMIHSLYSNREIFLRELISNASDACDKLRFEALHNEKLFESDFDLRIRVDYDPEARTLTVADNGVGHGGFELGSQADRVTLEVLDASGRVIDSADLGAMASGRHSFDWTPAAGVDPALAARFRITANLGTAAVAATTFTRDRVDAVSAGPNGLVLELANAGPLAYDQVKAFD